MNHSEKKSEWFFYGVLGDSELLKLVSPKSYFLKYVSLKSAPDARQGRSVSSASRLEVMHRLSHVGARLSRKADGAWGEGHCAKVFILIFKRHSQIPSFSRRMNQWGMTQTDW